MPEDERVRERPRLTQPVGERTRTLQSFKDECDVNFIVRQFAGGGQFTHTSKAMPFFADVSEAGTLQESFTAVAEASEEFMGLTSDVRSAAGNDPVQFLRMLEDPDGRAILAEAGLVDRVEEPAVIPVTFVPGGEPPVAEGTDPG